jgi:hypothetical protein
MDNTPKSTMLNACRSMLRPVVRLLLKNGVTWKEFADLSRSVYVQVAGDDYGISGRQTNASRVSILTGLTRREVKKQRDQLAGLPVAGPGKTSNATRLLSGWFQDPEFADADGTPRVLPREGESGSFEALHHRYGGDIPAVAMLKELTAAGAVREEDDGLRAISRYYMPSPLDPETVVRAGSVLNDLGSTVTWNLTRAEDEPSRFEGRATEPRIPLRLVAEFRDYMEARGQAFLEEVDRWLHQHRSDSNDDTHAFRLGVGVYMIANEDSGDQGITDSEGA